MRELINLLRHRLQDGQALVLVTITAATGATPRGAGARMLVGREGRLVGTIGGGAVEYRAEQMALQVLESGTSTQQNFSLDRGDVQELGMICGGAVEVFFHFIPAGHPETISLAEEAEKYFSAGEAMWLISNISRGGALCLYTKTGGFFGAEMPSWAAEQLPRRATVVEREGVKLCVEQICSPGRVYIFGGGHVSRELEPLLSRVGFRCVVLEDRPDFADGRHFPTAEEVRLVDFTRIDDFVTIGREDYVCILTRGHSYDTVVQAQVLRKKPRYVGVIGSRKKAAAVRRALAENFGLTDSELDLVTTPIGLDIGAETPAEIALSIAAQMIQVRAKLN